MEAPKKKSKGGAGLLILALVAQATSVSTRAGFTWGEVQL